MVFYFVVSGAFSCWFVCDCIPPPTPPIIYLRSRGGVVLVWHVCSHLSSLIFICQLFFHSFISMMMMIIITIVIIILLWSILIGFQCDWCPCWCCLILIWSSLCWSGGSWLGCWYCWPQGLFYPAGVRLQANCRVVLGTWPPLAINFVNSKKKQGWWSCGWLETSKIRFMFMNGISKEKDLKISKCNLA